MTNILRGEVWLIDLNPVKGHEQAGLKVKSFIKCEDIRSVSLERFIKKLGMVDNKIIAEVEQRLRILIGL